MLPKRKSFPIIISIVICSSASCLKIAKVNNLQEHLALYLALGGIPSWNTPFQMKSSFSGESVSVIQQNIFFKLVFYSGTGDDLVKNLAVTIALLHGEEKVHYQSLLIQNV